MFGLCGVQVRFFYSVEVILGFLERVTGMTAICMNNQSNYTSC